MDQSYYCVSQDPIQQFSSPQLNQNEKLSIKEALNGYKKVVGNSKIQLKSKNVFINSKYQMINNAQSSNTLTMKQERSNSQVSSIETFKTKASSNNSISPVIKKQSFSFNQLEAIQLTNLLSKSIAEQQRVCHSKQQQEEVQKCTSINKYPQMYERNERRGKQMRTQLPHLQEEGEAVRESKEQNKKQVRSDQAIKVTHTKIKQEDQENKENLQMLSSISIDYNKKQDASQSEDTLSNQKPLSNKQWDVKRQEMNNQLKQICQTYLDRKANSSKPKRIKINTQFTNEQITSPKLDIDQEQAEIRLQQEFKDQTSFINYNINSPLPNQQNNISQFQSKENFTQINQLDRKKHYSRVNFQNNIITNRRQNQIDLLANQNYQTNQNYQNSPNYHSNQIYQNNQSQISRGEKYKKNGLDQQQKKLIQQNGYLERQRALTTQNQTIDLINMSNIERQSSLPKIQLNSYQVNSFYNVPAKQIENNIAISSYKITSRKTSLQKRLSDLMNYNVEEEFKKRFQGLFNKSRDKSKLKIVPLKKNEIQKRVHFDELIEI